MKYTTIRLIPFKDHVEQKCKKKSKARLRREAGLLSRQKGGKTPMEWQEAAMLPAFAMFGGCVISMHDVDKVKIRIK